MDEYVRKIVFGLLVVGRILRHGNGEFRTKPSPVKVADIAGCKILGRRWVFVVSRASVVVVRSVTRHVAAFFVSMGRGPPLMGVVDPRRDTPPQQHAG